MPRFFLLLLFLLSLAAVALPFSPALAMEDGHFLLVAPVTPPYNIGPYGPPQGGLAPCLAERLFKRLGLPLVYRLYPIDIAMRLLRDGSADGAALMVKSSEREEYLLFSVPFLEGREQIYLNPARHRVDAWTRLEDLRGVRVGLVEKFAYSPPVMAALEQGLFQTDYAPDNTVALRRLAVGSVDAAICNEHMARKVLEQEPSLRSMVRPAAVELPPLTLHFAVSRRSPLAARLSEINAAILAMRWDGLEEEVWREAEGLKNSDR